MNNYIEKKRNNFYQGFALSKLGLATKIITIFCLASLCIYVESDYFYLLFFQYALDLKQHFYVGYVRIMLTHYTF